MAWLGGNCLESRPTSGSQAGPPFFVHHNRNRVERSHHPDVGSPSYEEDTKTVNEQGSIVNRMFARSQTNVQKTKGIQEKA